MGSTGDFNKFQAVLPDHAELGLELCDGGEGEQLRVEQENGAQHRRVPQLAPQLLVKGSRLGRHKPTIVTTALWIQIQNLLVSLIRIGRLKSEIEFKFN